MTKKSRDAKLHNEALVEDKNLAVKNADKPKGSTDGKDSDQSMDAASIGRAFLDLFGFLGKLKWPVVVACILSLGGAILNLIGPSKLGEITDLVAVGLNGSIDFDTLTSLAWLLVALYSAGFVLNYIQGYIMATVTQRITQRMRSRISDKIDRLPLSYLDRTPTGDVLSRMTNDVDTVGQTMNQSISTIVSSLATLIGSLVMMLVTDVLMTLAAVIATLIGVAITAFIIAKSQGHFLRQQEEIGRIDGHVEEVFGGLDVVRLYNGQSDAEKTFSSMNEDLYQAAWKANFLSGLMMPIMIMIGNLAYVAVCIVGGILVIQGSIGFGIVVAFMIYVRLFTQPLQNLSQAATSVQTMAAACRRVFDFLNEDEVSDESHKTVSLGKDEPISGEVSFSHVSFGYTPDREIIHDFSATAASGMKVAIVGPTGAGKTTVVNLLERFYEVDGGKITIDGVSTAELTRKNVRDLFGMVLQDTWLFEGTLRENLVFDGKTSDEELLKACKACGLDDWVGQLPQGLDTQLSGQTSVSVGQRQLLSIARAMLKDAPLLILDEATSSVDTRTELKVQQAMDTLMEDRTSFVIAHRLSTIRDANLILVMDNGDIVEQGTHAELLEKGGSYAALYNSQFDQ
ncbi:MAG: ABC transporter ATP-binding protein [Eggerthellaceae bacterium]|jgi:ATP-binding cassette subfamily B multidrug efflux pump